jgi:hypothetical protein
MQKRSFFQRIGVIAIIFFGLVIILSIFDVQTSLAVPINEPEQGTSARSGTTMPPTGVLKFRGGPVVKTPHTTYTIFWIPSGFTVSPRYQSLINGFLQNVALDSGKTSNIYHSATQYSDGSGSVVYQSIFGNSVVVTSPFPASECTMPNVSICLTDSQIQTKLAQVLAAQGWSAGMDKLYFMFLPKNVGSCYNSNSTFCLYQNYCGFHNTFTINTANVLYGLMPYAMGDKARCGSWNHPNGDDADSTINILAHEHNELLTDPLHNGWIDDERRERADRCVWNFGTGLGWTAYGKYNQTIGSGKYYIQSQWSNQAGACVLSGL